MKNIKKGKERIMAARPNLILSFIVAAVVTIIIFFTLPLLGSLPTFGIVGVYAGIFVFTFGFSFLLNNWKRYKNRFKMNKYSLFLVLSLIMSGIATRSSGGTWIDFIIGVGCCFAVFYIFWKFDYEHIKHTFLQFIKSFAYNVLFPSMFLCIVIIGNTDKYNVFMDKVIPQLNKLGDIISNCLILLVETLYNLGKYEYSSAFIIAIFVFLVLFASYDFLRKTKKGFLK